MPADEGFEMMRERLHRQMLSAVSHDLKTPLATIIGSLEIYERMAGKLSEQQSQTLIHSALGEAYRLDNFITNILDMGKLEAGMVTLRLERTNLENLVSDALIKLGPRRNHCEITTEHLGGSLVMVDPMLLSRAIGLVLENAVKYGGKNPRIHISYGCEGALCAVKIRDHGPGIPAGKEEEIFSKYTRFGKSDQQNAGTGLGLAICRQLMMLQSGTVSGTNHPEGGAVFTLSFPG